MAISVTDPVGLAINRAKLICFQPFNLGKWFALGFVAFLASLAEGGGGNIQFPNFGGARAPAPPPAPMPAPGPVRVPSRIPQSATSPATPNDIQEALNWVSANIGMVIVIALIAVLLVIGFMLLITWLSSRGQMMFVHNVANNLAEIREPWSRYREQANTLFGFRICLALIGFAAMILIGGLAVLLAWSDIRAQSFGGGAIAAIVVVLVLLVPFGIALGLIAWCTTQFVVPIMYVTGTTVMPAWTDFRANILTGHVGSLILFLLMQIVLGIAVMICTMIAGCATCCIGFLPYLSSVVTLPLSVFMRSYSIYFLQQFGPRYQIMVEMPPAPVAYGFPVVPTPPDFKQ